MVDGIDIGGIKIAFDVGTFAVVAIVVFIGLGFKMLIDGKYPKARFLVLHKGFLRVVNHRLDGDNIVEGDPLQLLLGRGRIGEDVKDFEKMLLVGAGPFMSGVIYIANEVKETLIPLRIELDAKNSKGVPLIIPAEVNNGKRIAIRFIEAKRFAMAQAKANENLLMAMSWAIPVALISVVMVAGMYFSFTMAANTLKETATANKEAAAIVANSMATYIQAANNTMFIRG